MDTTIEELTLLLLSLTATRDASANDACMRASLQYPATVIAALRARGLLDQITGTSVVLTDAGMQLASELEEHYLNGDERPDVAA